MRAHDLKEAGVDSVVEAMMIQKLADGPLKLTDLREAIDIPFSTASRLAWKLLELGLVVQGLDSKDRRIRIYSLTERGRALVDGKAVKRRRP